MKFSDIQLADKALWQQIQEEWSKGNFASAQAIMSNTQLDKKVLTAKSLNDLTDKIVEVEQLNDPTYVKDKIKIERQVPTDLTTGQVYFEWTNSPPYTWAEVDARNYTFADVDALRLTWAYADRGGW